MTCKWSMNQAKTLHCRHSKPCPRRAKWNRSQLKGWIWSAHHWEHASQWGETGTVPTRNQERSNITEAQEHGTKWMAGEQVSVRSRASWILEFQGRNHCLWWPTAEVWQAYCPRFAKRRDSRQPLRHWNVQAPSQGCLVLARNEPADNRHDIQVQYL